MLELTSFTSKGNERVHPDANEVELVKSVVTPQDRGTLDMVDRKYELERLYGGEFSKHFYVIILLQTTDVERMDNDQAY